MTCARTQRRRARLALAVSLAAVAASACAPAGALATTVYAAASLRDVFPQIDGRVTYSFAGSSQLQLQIERGAPADVFASASAREAQALFKAGRCGRPAVFATNVLVLIVPKASPRRVRSVYSLRPPPAKRLAVGSPGVPVGAYTRQLLARLRLGRVLTQNVVSNESNVAGVVSKVALGSADAGFVYRTDGRIAEDRVRTIALPTWAQPPARYAFCIVRRPGGDRAGAQAFVNRVRSAPGRRALRGAGFGVPAR